MTPLPLAPLTLAPAPAPATAIAPPTTPVVCPPTPVRMASPVFQLQKKCSSEYITPHQQEMTDPDPIFTKYARAGSTFVQCGGYGCGAFPAVPCGDVDDDNDDNNAEVSKLFKEPGSLEHELDKYKVFEALDPEGIYTVRLKKRCGVPSEELLPENIRDEGPFTGEQLKYEYGGKTLAALFFKGDPVDFSIVDDILKNQFPKMIRFLILMRDNGVAHNDIHPDNITWSPTKGLRLIDFGSATSGTATDVFRSSKDKTALGSVLVQVLRSIHAGSVPSVLWTERFENAQDFFKYVYLFMDLEEVRETWELVLHESKSAFATNVVKPALLRVAEWEQTFTDNPEALATASALAHNLTVSVNNFQIFLKQCFLDMVRRTNPSKARQTAKSVKIKGTLESFAENPQETFRMFVGRFGKL